MKIERRGELVDSLLGTIRDDEDYLVSNKYECSDTKGLMTLSQARRGLGSIELTLNYCFLRYVV